MDRIRRITETEKRPNAADRALSGYRDAHERFERVQSDIEALSRSCGSREWRDDLAEHAAKRLPADLRCGVLLENRKPVIDPLEALANVQRACG